MIDVIRTYKFTGTVYIYRGTSKFTDGKVQSTFTDGGVVSENFEWENLQHLPKYLSYVGPTVMHSEAHGSVWFVIYATNTRWIEQPMRLNWM